MMMCGEATTGKVPYAYDVASHPLKAVAQSRRMPSLRTPRSYTSTSISHMEVGDKLPNLKSALLLFAWFGVG